MRLTNNQVMTIKELAAEIFGKNAAVFLFGSRVDDSKRGGDIDLYIETNINEVEKLVDAKLKFLAKLKQRIGDQRIDLVLDYPTQQSRPAVSEIARKTGVRL